jgi:D-glycero-alpha-D-manno-heptose 1-phosphate guanylyltransferase
MISEAIILAGGFGTRLQKVVQDTPKPMALINNRPFLEYQINYLKSHGINHIVLSVGYLSDQIIGHFKDSFNGVDIDYAIEKTPLGTGGGIKLAFDKLHTQNSVVVNGDTIFDINLQDLYKYHQNKNSKFSLALRMVNEVSRYGNVLTDDNNRILKFAEKGTFSGKGVINGGTYIINKSFFEEVPLPAKFSLETDVFERFYSSFSFYGFQFEDYFLDIGIPEDYKKAQDDFAKLGY